MVRRTPEIGIRMALGAERIRVIGMVMSGAMVQAGIGLVIGVPIAMLCVRYVKSQLYEITSVDAGVMVSAISLLTVAACIAAHDPARRAASIDPVKALRVELHIARKGCVEFRLRPFRKNQPRARQGLPAS